MTATKAIRANEPGLPKHVEDLLNREFKVFPIRAGAKFPPLVVGGCLSASVDPRIVAEWSETFGTCNWGIHCKDLLVVDVDANKGGFETLEKLGLPQTLTASTPSGGYHLFYRKPGGVKNSVELLGPGIDVRSNGGYVVAVGSVVDGKRYEWADDRPIESAPDWLVEKCGTARRERSGARDVPEGVDVDSAVAKAETWLEFRDPAVEGKGGDDWTYQTICKVRDFGVPRDQALEVLSYWNERNEPPWGTDELEQKVNNAYRYGQNPAGALAAELDYDFEEATEGETGVEPKTIEPGDRASWVKQSEESLLHRLNRNHFLIKIEGKVLVGEEHSDGRLSFMTTEDFVKWHKPVKMVAKAKPGVNAKKTTLGDAWLNWAGRREYRHLVFAPGVETPKHTYNLWKGWAVEPKQGDWSLFRTHIRDIVCAGDEAVFQWVLGWLAHMVQRPSVVPETAIAIVGGQGTGKGKFAQWVGALAPRHYVHATDPEQVVGRFNSHLEDCLLLFMDEALFAGSKAAADKMKTRVSERRFLVERKFQPARMVDSRLHVIVASNHAHALHVEADDRRYCVLNISDARRKDYDYFQAIDEQMANGGLAAMLWDLMHRDLTEFQVRRAPATEGLLEQKAHSLDGPARYLRELLIAGEMVGEFGEVEWGETGIEADKSDVYEDYKRSEPRTARPVVASQFWRDVARLVGGRKMRKGSDGDRKQVWVFPRLSKAREKFEKEIGGRLEW